MASSGTDLAGMEYNIQKSLSAGEGNVGIFNIICGPYKSIGFNKHGFYWSNVSLLVQWLELLLFSEASDVNLKRNLFTRVTMAAIAARKSRAKMSLNEHTTSKSVHTNPYFEHFLLYIYNIAFEEETV